MGRTLKPYSMQMDLVEERFKNFRRALRKEDQKIFDELIHAARLQAQAGVMASAPNPFDSMAMAMLIEMRRENRILESRLEALEETVRKMRRAGSDENH